MIFLNLDIFISWDLDFVYAFCFSWCSLILHRQQTWVGCTSWLEPGGGGNSGSLLHIEGQCSSFRLGTGVLHWRHSEGGLFSAGRWRKVFILQETSSDPTPEGREKGASLLPGKWKSKLPMWSPLMLQLESLPVGWGWGGAHFSPSSTFSLCCCGGGWDCIIFLWVCVFFFLLFFFFF